MSDAAANESATCVVFIGLDDPFDLALPQACHLVYACNIEDGLRQAGEATAALFVLGPGASKEDIRRLFDAWSGCPSMPSWAALVLGATVDRADVAPLVEAGWIVYATWQPILCWQKAALINAALQRLAGLPDASASLAVAVPARTRQTEAEIPSFADAAKSMEQALGAAVTGISCQCLFYDSIEGTLAPDFLECSDYDSAASGIAGYAALTGVAVCVDDASRDPRFDADVDRYWDSGDCRMLVVPVRFGGRVIAIVAIWRSLDHPPFSRAEVTAVEHLLESDSSLTRTYEQYQQLTATVLLSALPAVHAVYRMEALCALVQRNRQPATMPDTTIDLWVGWWGVLVLLAGGAGALVLQIRLML